MENKRKVCGKGVRAKEKNKSFFFQTYADHFKKHMSVICPFS
jgi:hypothetical protein